MGTVSEWIRRNPAIMIATLLVGIFLATVASDVLSAWELTKTEQVALFILMTAATLWITEAVPLFVTSLMVLFLSIVWLAPAMRMEGKSIETSVFMGQFFSDIIVLFLGGFVLSAALNKLRLNEWLARLIIRRAGASVPTLMLGVMSITAFFSMWLSNTAAAAMMLALVIPITNRLPAGDRYRKGLLLSISFAPTSADWVRRLGVRPTLLPRKYLKQIGQAPSFGMWMLIAIPLVLVMLGLAWTVLRVLFRGKRVRFHFKRQTANDRAYAVTLSRAGDHPRNGRRLDDFNGAWLFVWDGSHDSH